jgi:hypothetical protein
MRIPYWSVFAGLALAILSCTDKARQGPVEQLPSSVNQATIPMNHPPQEDVKKSSIPNRIGVREKVFELTAKYPVASPTLPTIQDLGSPFYVVYKDSYYEMHTGPDPRNDTRGFTTEVIRFPTLPADGERSSQSAWISQIRTDGEQQGYRYLIQRESEFLRITYLRSETVPKEYKIIQTSDGVEVLSDEDHYKLAINESGDLEYWYLNAATPELLYIWSRRFGGVFSSSDSVLEPSDGRFEGGLEKPIRYVERPRNDPGGGSDTEIYFAYPPEGIWLNANGIEPVCECLLVGLREWLRGGNLLERYAIARIVLRQHGGLEAILAATVLDIDGEG